MGLKEVFIGVIIVLLFSLSAITFGSKLLIDNNAQNNILDDPSLSGFNDSLGDYLGDIEQNSQTQREAIEGQEAQGGSTDEGFGLTSIVGAVFTFFSTSVNGLNLIFSLILLLVPPMVLNVLLGLFIMVVVILAWRTFKVGGT